MQGAGAIRAGQAFVEMHLRDREFLSRLDRTKFQLNELGRTAAGVGASLAAVATGVLAPVVMGTKAFVQFGDEMDKMALRTGFSRQALQEFYLAAELTGASIQEVEGSVRAMQNVIRNAERGLARAGENLRALNLTSAQLQGLRPEEQFRLIADRLSAIEDPSRRAGLAIQILGRNGQRLLPLFEAGPDGFRAMAEEARKLNIPLSDKQIADAAAMQDAITRLTSTITRVGQAIGASIAPILTPIMNVASQIIASISWAIDKLPVLGYAVAAVGVSIAAVAGALLTVAAVSFVVAQGISSIAKAVVLLNAASLPWMPIILGIGAALAAATGIIGLVFALFKLFGPGSGDGSGSDASGVSITNGQVTATSLAALLATSLPTVAGAFDPQTINNLGFNADVQERIADAVEELVELTREEQEGRSIGDYSRMLAAQSGAYAPMFVRN